MSNTLQASVIHPGEFHNYNIAGNVTNAFALGEIGSVDDFFLVGLEPHEDSLYPLLTGNILDSEGNLLFQLRNNIIKLNPGQCSKILGSMVGYEIHDSAGKLIFKVQTVFQDLSQTYVTTIKANFYNKAGGLVFNTTSGDSGEKITTTSKNLFGYSNGSIGIIIGYNQEEIEFLRFVFNTRNPVSEPIRGLIEGQTIELSGKALLNATIRNCKIIISDGDFISIGDSVIGHNNFSFVGSAAQVLRVYQGIKQDPPQS